MSKKVTVAMIGSGFAADIHMDGYERVSGVDVTVKGVYSPTAESRKAFAAEHGLAKVYNSYDEVLNDPEIDIVDLCVPPKFHAPLAIEAADAGKHAAIEKPLTGYFGATPDATSVEGIPKRQMLEEAVATAEEMVAAFKASGTWLLYAENWVYAPGIQKANRLLAESENTILRIVGEESHSGTHSQYSKQWIFGGGGSLINKGCHPLGAAIYLKREEGLRRDGKAIRPVRVRCEVANLTEIPSFVAEEEKFIKTGWQDAEDWGVMIVTFSDGSVAQITSADTVIGGIQNFLRIYASKTTIHCNQVPNDTVMAYAPREGIFGDEYIREKVETTAGWQSASPDEHWMNGFPHEMEDFCRAVVEDRSPLSDGWIGREVTAVCYAAYTAAEEGGPVEVPAPKDADA